LLHHAAQCKKQPVPFSIISSLTTGKYSNRMRWLAVLAIIVTVLVAALMWKKRGFVKYMFHQAESKVLFCINYLRAPPLSPQQLGDGGSALSLRLFDPACIAEDEFGAVYILDRGRVFRGRMIWKIDGNGKVHAIAGTGRAGEPRPGDNALKADLARPCALCIDRNGRVVFADGSMLFRIEANGQLTRIGGISLGATKFDGQNDDGGLATETAFNQACDVRSDRQGNLFVADTFSHRIRKITTDGHIYTVAGTGEAGFSGNGGPAALATLNTPYGIFVDSQGRLLIADSENHVIRRVDENGLISTIAGTGKPGYAGDGGPARSAMLNSPQSLFVDQNERIYIGDEHNNVIRVIDGEGRISTFIGTGTDGFATDGTSAKVAQMSDPESVLVRGDGSVLVADGDNGRILVMKQDGRVYEFAGANVENRSTR
jgi:hypothetical protein